MATWFLVLSLTAANATVRPVSNPAWVPASVSGFDLLAANATASCRWHYCDESDNNATSTECRCDVDCWQRRDCCLDFWRRWQAGDSILDALSDGARFALWSEQGGATCQTFLASYGLPREYAHYMAVSTCPVSSAAPCAPPKAGQVPDRLLHVPVYSRTTGVTYGNLCYAACHRDAANVHFWNTTLRCPKTSAPESAAEASGDKRCHAELRPPTDVGPLAVPCREARPKVKSTCDPTWRAPNDAILTLCHIVRAQIIVDGRAYSNIYCALCNGADPSSAQCLPLLGMCPRPPCLPKSVSTMQTKSFAVLFDTNFQSKGRILGVERLCPTPDQLYDPFRAQCRHVFCSAGRDYRDGQCVGQPAASRSRSQHLDLDCPKMQLDVNDSSIDDNGTLTVAGTRFASGSYERVNGSVVVCADLGRNYVSKFPGAAFEWLTVVGSALSLVSLGLKMAIFVLLPETRNFPDRVVFSLCASLFVAQLLFTVAVTDTSQYGPCAAVAVVTHYAFLATFCWMTALAFDVWHAFASVEARPARARSDGAKYLRYSLCAWSAPLVVVSVASVCEWGPLPLPAMSPLRPYYGQALCWISSRPALLVYFVAPVSLLLLANLVFFGFTSWNICASSRQTSLAQKSAPAHRAHHLHFCLYFKLGVILGLTWISGFVAAYADQPPFWYLFVALNTLQGVYILLAFTSHRKVKRCLERHLQRRNYYGRGRGAHHVPYANGHQPLQRSSTQSTSVSTGSTQRTSVFSTMSAA